MHSFYPGDPAQVCKSEGNMFSCPTMADVACDKARCPLQGPPMAPIMEPHPTG